MRLLVIDGNSIANRAFYGIKLLTTKDGRYTNAIFGFLNILLSLLKECGPDEVAVAFDLKAPTFRHKMYDGYKATRHKMPDELAAQMPVLKELLAALGYREVTAEGWEADDILGTLSAACAARSDDCFLATGDRDSLQLVSDTTTVLLATTAMGRSKTAVMDVDAVKEKYGVSPRQLIDVKSLMGDTSDNIPGVKGIGEKSAITLIQKYGSLAGVYAHLDDTADKTIKPKQREHLAEDRAMAELSYTLGTIRTDAPIDTAEGAYVVGEGNKAEAVRLMQELELHSLIARFGLSDIAPAADPERASIEPLQAAEVPVLPAEPKGHYLVAARPAVMGKQGTRNVELQPAAWYAVQDKAVFPLEDDDLLRLLDNEDVTLDVFDSAPLYARAMAAGNWGSSIVWDGKLAAYLLDASASKYNLSELIISYRADAAFTCEKWPDAGALADLFAKMKAEITALGEDSLYNDIEFPLAQVLADMTRIGILVDKEGIEKFGVKMRSELEEVLTRIHMETGSASFNPNSPKQLGEMLFDTMGLPHGKKTQRGWSTDAETLEAVPRLPEAELHLRRRPAEGHRGGWPHPHPLQPDRSPHRTAFLRQPQPAEHPHPHRAGQPAPRLLCGAARLRAGGRRLQPDRAAHPRPRHRRRAYAAGLPHRRGHPPQHCRQNLWSAPRAGHAPPALFGKSHQLRHHVRQGRLQPLEGHRRERQRSRRLPEKLSGHLPESQRLHGQDHLRRPELRLCVHPLRTPPLSAGAGQQQSQHPGQRRADGPQHADPRHCRRRHQAGDGAGLAASAGREDGEPPHPDRPRRTHRRGPGGRSRESRRHPAGRDGRLCQLRCPPEHRSASGQKLAGGPLKP